MVDFPAGWKRTPADERDRGHQFHVEKGVNKHGWTERGMPNYYQASERLLGEAGRIPGASDVQIDCDLRFRQDGALYSKQRAPEDPGVVLRFKRHGVPFAIPCDRFDSVEANCVALALMVESQRRLERYGFDVFQQDFRGYAALPPGSDDYEYLVPEEPPHSILGVAEDADEAVIRAVYRAKSLKAHPDRGGSDAEFKRLTRARDAMLRQVTG